MNNSTEQQEMHKTAIQYPNLFRHYVEGCRHTFDSIQMLTDKGYQTVDSWPSEVASVLRTDEIVLSSHISKNLYVKQFDSYQIMHIVSKIIPGVSAVREAFSNEIGKGLRKFGRKK